MAWVVFIYSASSGGQNSSQRVSVWRRLQRLGAVSPRSGVYVLPARADCVDALHWLAKEVQQGNGESLVMRVDDLHGITDQELCELFRKNCQKDYIEIEGQALELERQTDRKLTAHETLKLRGEITKLRKKYAEINRIDFFESPLGARVSALLSRVELALSKNELMNPEVPTANLTDYKGRVWMTRPRPHVDRLSSAWLIRRFIDPSAVINYKDQAEPNEVSFDLKVGASFGHIGNLCTFEVLVRSFQLKEKGLKQIAEIVHEIDLRDGVYWHPELPGIELILKGWRQTTMTDLELESHGIALFEGLFQSLHKLDNAGETINKPAGIKKKV